MRKIGKTSFLSLIVYSACLINGSAMIEANLSMDIRHLMKNQISFYEMLPSFLYSMPRRQVTFVL